MGDDRIIDRVWQRAFRIGYVLAMGYWALRRPRAHGVGVAVWWDTRVLLIDNAYKSYRGLPGGGIHSGETLAAAAARELAEEVGIRADTTHLTPAGTYAGQVDFKQDRVTVYELILERKPVVRVDRREVVSAGFVTLAEAMGQRLNPMIRDYLLDCRAAGGPMTSIRSRYLSQASP